MTDPRRAPMLDRPPSNRRTSGTGARAADGGGGGRKKRGLLPLLLGLLALAAIAALLIGLLGGDDESSQPASDQGGSSAQSDSAAEGGSTAQGGSGGGGDAGTLAAGGAAVLPSAAADIGQHAGERAEGKAVVVQSVVQNAEDPDALEGFWVGASEQDRVYIEWGGDVGANEATYQPKVGEKVDLSGPVKAAPEKAERVLNLSPADARIVKEQGAYVNAEDVKPTG